MKASKYLLLFLFIIIGLNLSAQYNYPGEDETVKVKKKGWYSDSKLFFGGVPGLMFGSITYIELPPYVGYKFTPFFWAGIGPLYQYYKQREPSYETSIYGGKAFVQLFLIKDLKDKININLGDIFIYGESSMLNIEPYYYTERKWVDVTLIGFGFRYPLGNRSGFSLNILWDITQNPDYSYTNPEVRIGFDL
jgi:hypothetical protein